MIFSPRIARGFYLLSAYQKATTIFVVAKFNFTANFARRRQSFLFLAKAFSHNRAKLRNARFLSVK